MTIERPLTFQRVAPNRSRWEPSVGDFTTNYLSELKSLSPENRTRILNESIQILGDCTPPSTSAYSEAGLVVGYVQSGKTMSFTTLTALARDNGYGLVIVLTGVTNLLKSQSIERLVDDLMLEEHFGEWRIFENPGSSTVHHSNPQRVELESKLKAWERFQYLGQSRKPSVLVTVLKSSTRLKNLANLLRTLDLTRVPTLVIDDESDQATPNLKSSKNLKTNASEESSTYAAISFLRSTLPRHSYLQYTATPQANLLAAKSDSLSPKFARVISAGEGYTGGEFFFSDPEFPFVRVIPEEDTIKPAKLPEEPPESLLDALRSFWLGAAVAVLERHTQGARPSTRSMMIQVSQMTAPQSLFRSWAQSLQIAWKDALRDETKASHSVVIEEFHRTFLDLKTTYNQIPRFEDLCAELADVMEETRIVEVNSADEAVKTVEWFHSQFWILVGGMKLDRGFTVRGITTTYMPRSVAENADTLQQRARFFGYHKAYAGLCRIFLGAESLNAFVKYLEHETALRTSLDAAAGLPLSDWKRSFILNRALKRATKRSVIGRNLRRQVLPEGWVQPHGMHVDGAAALHNFRAFETFTDWLENAQSNAPLPGDWKDERKQSTGHKLYKDISIERTIDLLVNLRFVDINDAAQMLAVCTSLTIEQGRNSNLRADIVLVNSLDMGSQTGRDYESDVKVKNIFIGRNPKTAGNNVDDLIYVGDREIHTENPTLHLRMLKFSGLTSDFENLNGIPWVSVWLGDDLQNDFLEEIDD